MKVSLGSSLLTTSTILLLLHSCVTAHNHDHIILNDRHTTPARYSSNSDHDPVPYEKRAHWMRRARTALLELDGTPCPFGAYGTAIVNHTAQPEGSLGELVCIGANQVAQTGNPGLHGEIAAINNCTVVLGKAPYNLDPQGILAAFKQLSLYTTCEACPMCATAISWAEFSEYIYATSIWRQYELGWKGVTIDSHEILEHSPIADSIRIVGGVLADETDELLAWQFAGGECPEGCAKEGGEGQCVVVK